MKLSEQQIFFFCAAVPFPIVCFGEKNGSATRPPDTSPKILGETYGNMKLSEQQKNLGAAVPFPNPLFSGGSDEQVWGEQCHFV